MSERASEQEREAETQAEGEAGSRPGARCGTLSRDSRIAPWAKGRRQTTEPPRDPQETDFKCSSLGDPWVAQWFGACLWPRARSWSPGIRSRVGLPAWGLLLPLPVSLLLCVCVCVCVCVSIMKK